MFFFDSLHFLSSIHDSGIISLIGTRNGIFYGMAYVSLGYYFAKKTTVLDVKKSILGMIASFILLGGEGLFCVYVLKTESTVLCLSVLPLMFFIFSLSLNMNQKKLKLQYLIRKCSIVMYCVHPLFITIFQGYFQNMLLFIVVSILSLIFSISLYFLSKTKYLAWLSYLQ